MALDEALLNGVGAGHVPPTFRLYGWSPACLSLGYGQSEAEVDQDALTQHGWSLVRRMTGGRAILHVDELTYSITLPLTHPLAQGGIIESYRRLSAALLLAVQMIGAGSEATPHPQRTGSRPGPVCFETPSDYEITAEGRKLIGSAQVRRSTVMLQHGTLPLQGNLTRICEALHFPTPEARQTARHRVLQRAITLSEALGRAITWEEVADALQAAVEQSFGVTLHESPLTPAEYDQTQQLITEKYAHPNWTFRTRMP